MSLPRLLHGRRARLLGALALNGLAQAGAVVAIAFAIRAALDAPVDGSPRVDALGAALAGALAAAVMAALRWRERVDAEALAQSYVYRVRTRLLEKLRRLEPATLARRGHGSVLLRFAGDLTAIAQWVGRGVARLLVSGIVVAAVCVAVATFEVALAATLALGLAIAAGAAGWRTARLDAAILALRRARGRLVTRVNGTLNRLPELDAGGELPRATRRLGRGARDVRDASLARAREVAAVDAIAEVGALAIPAAVLCAALAGRAHGGASHGELVAVLGVALLVAGPVRELGRVFDYWRRATLARAKLVQFLALPERRGEPVGLAVAS